MSSTLKLFIVIIILAVLGALVYFSVTSGVVKNPDDIFTLASPEAALEAETVSRDINNVLAEFRGIGTITIEGGVFESPVYKELRATVLPATPAFKIGRENPFLQIGEEARRAFDNELQRMLRNVPREEMSEQTMIDAVIQEEGNGSGISLDEYNSFGTE